jgi:hypothetical protein
VWTTTLDSVAALVVDSILTARIQPLPGLLESEEFRTVVVLAPRPTLEVAPAVVCLPHSMHEANQLPATIGIPGRRRDRPTPQPEGRRGGGRFS